MILRHAVRLRLRCCEPVQLRRFASSSTARDTILYHYLPKPVPYLDGLKLQEALVSRRLEARNALAAEPDSTDDIRRIAEQDVLLLLQHTPVYTTGRRDTDEDVLKVERERLTAIGADYIATQRGGQTTYHGPGQLVGYPIFDTAAFDVRQSRMAWLSKAYTNVASDQLSTRCYVQRISDVLDLLLEKKLYIPLLKPSPHVGAYPTANTKIGSIGIQIRHRITSHGFAVNVTDDVKYWFDLIIACGNPDIKATTIESELVRLNKAPAVRKEVYDIVPLAVDAFENIFKRKMRPIKAATDLELMRVITECTGQSSDP